MLLMEMQSDTAALEHTLKVKVKVSRSVLSNSL